MPNFMERILKTLLVLLIPIILILGSARLLATDTYLAFEYGKSNFPPDSYGFTTQQRGDEAQAGSRIGKDRNHACSAADFAMRAFHHFYG